MTNPKQDSIRVAISTSKVGDKKFEARVLTTIVDGNKESDFQFPIAKGKTRREAKLKMIEMLDDHPDSFSIVKQHALKQ